MGICGSPPPQPAVMAIKIEQNAHETVVAAKEGRNLFVKIIFFLHIRQGGLSFMMTVENSAA
ncbi:MAG TPA: hypothetical protein DDZ51_20715 [Planctomycetaceae bacterium]|nr:hypothetical protein [Planctomycetaceae bacterium]